MTLCKGFLYLSAFVLSLTGTLSATGPLSDNFNTGTLNTGLWTFVNPVGDGSESLTGTNLLLTVPAGVSHDVWSTGDNAARILQPITNVDFEVMVKMDTPVTAGSQMEGILVEQSSTTFLRFDVRHDGVSPRLFAASISGTTGTFRIDFALPRYTSSFWLKVKRTGNSWTESYSTDGVTFLTGGTFSFTLTASKIGVFSGNYGNPSSSAPALSASFDYFLNTAAIPDMTLTKTHAGNFPQGGTGDYTLTAANTGTASTTAPVTVTDTLPAGLTATAFSGTGWTCSLAPAVSCTRGDVLAAGGSYPPLDLKVSVASNAPASVTNTATVAGGGETNNTNNSASDQTTIVLPATPDMTLTKTHSGSFIQGGTGSYTITATNSGTAQTTAPVTVTDTLPGGLAATSFSGSGWTCVLTPSPSCSRNDPLNAGASYPGLTLTVSVAANAPANVTNVATVAGGGEANTANDTASDPTVITPPATPDMTVSKMHTGNFTQGRTGTYTITVTNSGSGATSATVTVTDTLPTGLTATAISGTGWQCTLTPALSCSRSDVVNPLASYPALTLSVNVAVDAPASVTNTVAVAGGGETNTSNNSASDVTLIQQPQHPPIIANISSTPSSVSATITWTTDETASSQVDYGTTSSYGSVISNSSLVTSHSLALNGLVCATAYQYKVTSVDASGDSSSSGNLTFMTGTCPAGGPVSDNFDAPTLNQTLWTFVNPLGDGVVTMNGSEVQITVPHGRSHDVWTAGNQSARLLQSVADVDFQVEIRFNSIPMSQAQIEGIIVQQDTQNYIRFDTYYNGVSARLFCAVFSGGNPSVKLDTPIVTTSFGPPFWLRVRRSGNTWTQSYSTDGVTYTTGATFSQVLSVTAVGPFAGNATGSAGDIPAFTASVDYFFNSASPLTNKDGPLLFDRFVVDANPPTTTLLKTFADIDGDGRADAVIGFGNPPGSNTGAGLAWYQSPHSGKLSDKWNRYSILSSGNMYEDSTAYDVNHDGAIDVIASFNASSAIYWFENPRGHGGNPATDAWVKHFIGNGSGENNMLLADIDGDGKTDLVTNGFIFFQNGPDAWVPVPYNRISNGVATLDIGSGNGAINLIGLASSSPYPFVWLENPREHGGNARTDPWVAHVIGPGFDTTGNAPPAFATADLNGDGRMDVVTVRSEGTNPPEVIGALWWWEAPADRRNGTWIQHVVDATYTSAHSVRAVDVDGDGTIDLVTAEQEQAAERRVSVFYNDGTGSFSQRILSNGSGHNITVGDLDGNGSVDILNAGHGFFGAPHPVEVYRNRK